MRGLRRTVHLLLAAFLLASTVSVAAHYSAHAKANAEQCLLCASHAGANPAATAPEQALSACESPALTLVLSARSEPAPGYRISPPSRGPPSAA
jgi:hypothetical protein